MEDAAGVDARKVLERLLGELRERERGGGHRLRVLAHGAHRFGGRLQAREHLLDGAAGAPAAVRAIAVSSAAKIGRKADPLAPDPRNLLIQLTTFPSPQERRTMLEPGGRAAQSQSKRRLTN